MVKPPDGSPHPANDRTPRCSAARLPNALPPIVADAPAPPLKAESRNLSFHYGKFQALKGITMPVHEHQVTALIGPSGCGKSTFLRCFNRMHDLYAGNRYEGEIVLHPDNTNLLARDVDPIEVRMRVCDGVPEAEPVSEVDLRERRVRAARARRHAQERSSTTRSRSRCAARRFGTK